LNWDAPMFRPPAYRHVVGRDESAADMVERAACALFDRLGADARRGLDVILTNVLLPDVPFTGVGATVAHRLGARPEWVLDVHNAGCASFVMLLRLAKMIIETTSARTALLCNVQNAAGTIFSQPDVITSPPSAIPGDGAAAAYVAASSESPVLDVEIVHLPEAAPDVQLEFSDNRRYWEPGSGQLNVRFTEANVEKIIARGSRIVPDVVRTVCSRIGVDTGDIDVLITNQPNQMFLHGWSTALGLDRARHLDTFDRYGNLFGAAAPITLSHAIEDGAVPDGGLVVLAGFAHAGDLAGAAAVRWRAGG
ncbi:MAG TPA: 3-oxoacyl-[acyl-carrier-protein] synthase III C-terminal domain-containing protein, partial [Pseudonocardiaceae bacterium]